MIRVYKHPDIPPELTSSRSLNSTPLLERLRRDHRCKCYLCERRRVTDFQVEHLRSRVNFPDLATTWNNLFWACSYCNGKKSGHFDNILHPVENDIETMITQRFDFPGTSVSFRPASGNSSPETGATIRLLSNIFNGAGRLRTLREQAFYDYARGEINTFQRLVTGWLRDPSPENREAVAEALSINAEFLGFKYWIIRSNPRLAEAFASEIRWNRTDSE